jgi:23S rRNA (cytosine1962-C5)-methyltransferase
LFDCARLQEKPKDRTPAQVLKTKDVREMPIVKNPFLYEDRNWLVLNKPTGLSTHTPRKGDLGLVEWLKLHQDREIHICSRLDKGTSGVLVLALSPEANALAEKIHNQGQARKTYYFISDREPTKGKSWTCRKYLDARPCSTSFELIRGANGYFLFRAVIARGRRHQIRRHAAVSGVPILGDGEHGGTPFPRLCLHCGAVFWPEVTKKLAVEFPRSFEWLLAGRSRTLIEAAVAYERRMGLLETVSDAFRLVHRGELSDIPCAIDLYGQWLCITGFDEKLPSKKLNSSLRPVLDYYKKLFGCKGGLIRTHRADPHHRELFGDVIHWGEPPPETFLIREHDLLFEVALNDTQHAGLFLDQRDSRRRIWQAAHGKRVANLFSFTCSFSAAAVKGGAETVFSIDSAAGCLDRGKNNFDHNDLSKGGRGKFIQEDVRKWLARQRRKKLDNEEDFQTWDLIICDPPVFASTGKGQSFSVEKAWPKMAEDIREILSENAVALFANNHMRGSEEFYTGELKKCFSRVTRLYPPFDFPQQPGTPAHVRIYWCEA